MIIQNPILAIFSFGLFFNQLYYYTIMPLDNVVLKESSVVTEPPENINELWTNYFEEQGCTSFNVSEGGAISCYAVEFNETNIPSHPVNVSSIGNINFNSSTGFDFNLLRNINTFKDINAVGSDLNSLGFLENATLTGGVNDFRSTNISDITPLDTVIVIVPSNRSSTNIFVTNNNISVYTDPNGNLCNYYNIGDVYGYEYYYYC